MDRLGFYLHSAELVNHYRNVWMHLSPGSFDVVLDEHASEADRSLVHGKCEELGVEVLEGEALLASGLRLDTLVSNHPVGLHGDRHIIEVLGSRNIRFMYALGKAGWNLRPWNRLYDMILCFGPYQVEQLQFCEQTLLVQMGYPRFDAFYNEPLNRDAALTARGADPARSTLVWLPTWSALSSIDTFAGVMSRLSATYNVLVKVHPLTASGEPERMARMRALSFTQLIETPDDNVPLYQVADYVVCDYGGPAFGAIYVDRKLVLLNVHGARNDEVTGEHSPDIRVREVIASVDRPEADAIEAVVGDAAMWEAQARTRFALRRALFSPFHGFSARVAAEALSRSGSLLETVPEGGAWRYGADG